jgi:Ni,Fe-hydrogenase III small subunit/Pyruvate/2-oxoacid:ferredoxin oxidoreductase delta subunit
MGLYEIFNILKKPANMNFDKASPVHNSARGIPVPLFGEKESCKSCRDCETLCPTKAIKIKSDTTIQFDYGACLQCGLCVEICPKEKIVNSGFNYAFSFHREELVVEYSKGKFSPKEFSKPENVVKFQELTKGKGFNYREVAASGNNSVECELNASFNNVFDSEGNQVRSVASPKHADAIVYSGPVGVNMQEPLQIAWDCMPEPKALIACGTEAIMGGVYPMGKIPKTPDLFIAGDPPRPDVSIQAFRYLMGEYQFDFQKELTSAIQDLKQKGK